MADVNCLAGCENAASINGKERFRAVNAVSSGSVDRSDQVGIIVDANAVTAASAGLTTDIAQHLLGKSRIRCRAYGMMDV